MGGTRAAHGTARLTRREFARGLRLGLGRARIDVRRHGLAGREDLLVAVCLRNPTRDTQIEGHIDGWLLDVARDGGATAAVRRAILDAASRRIVHRRDRDQISSVLAQFALDGDRVAARALLRMIDLQVPCALLAPNAIWALGETGWRRVIRSYGRRWDEAGRFDWSWIVHAADRELGPRRMLAVLRDERQRHARLRPLADLVESEERAARNDHPEPTVDASLDALERLVRTRRRRDVYRDLRRWAKHASDVDRAKAWRRLIAETDGRLILRRLWAWGRQPPPTLHPRLLELAEHPIRLVRFQAASVLGKLKDARIRALAMRMLREAPIRAIDGGVLDLLELNARDEDAAVIDAALARRASREVVHNWVRGVLNVVEPLQRVEGTIAFAKPRRSRVWTPLLVRALETSPCRACREFVLRRLVESGAATESMLREALFDANSHTRELAREALAKLRAARAPGGSRGRR
jgi:hypothetical protein